MFKLWTQHFVHNLPTIMQLGERFFVTKSQRSRAKAW